MTRIILDFLHIVLHLSWSSWPNYVTALQYSTLHHTTLHCIILNCTALDSTTLQHYIALHYTMLHWAVVQCTSLHCTAYRLYLWLVGENKEVTAGRNQRRTLVFQAGTAKKYVTLLKLGIELKTIFSLLKPIFWSIKRNALNCHISHTEFCAQFYWAQRSMQYDRFWASKLTSIGNKWSG